MTTRGLSVAITALLIACGSAPKSTPSSAAAPSPSAPSSSPPPPPPAPVPPAIPPNLAESVADLAALPASGLRVAISTEDLRVEGAFIAPLPPRESAAAGFDAAYKRNGAADTYLVALEPALKAPHGKGALVSVDAHVTYRVLSEVLYTLGQNGIGEIHLLAKGALAHGAIGSLDAGAPRIVPSPAIKGPQPIEVTVRADGIRVKAYGANLTEGCADVGEGVAVPNASDGTYDFTALGVCGVKLSRMPDRVTNEVKFAASPSVEFQTVVTALNALHANFSRVTFAFPR